MDSGIQWDMALNWVSVYIPLEVHFTGGTAISMYFTCIWVEK